MLTLIAAIDQLGGIGLNGGIPWKAPEDMKRFKRLTTGHPVIMGRKTWDSLPSKQRPLPDRPNIVVTRSNANWAEAVVRAGSMDEAVEKARVFKGEEIFVIGGAEIYERALPFADKMLLTFVHRSHPCDTKFPLRFGRDWVISRDEFIPAKEDAPALSFLHLEPCLDAARAAWNGIPHVNTIGEVILFAEAHPDVR